MDEMPSSTTPVLDLQPGRLLRVRDGDGLGIAVFDGLVWVTQDGDSRDIFLGRGEAFAFARQGMALVEAISPARVAVCVASLPRDSIRTVRAPTARDELVSAS